MNKNLPISYYLDEIIETVMDNDVVIVKAETGSGKSTQIPQALYKYGYEVVVTQPRRVAARSVARRVAEEMNCRLGTLVGYRTGFERLYSSNTKILFCTDGLELSRELMNKNDNKERVLCIDEVHEWNLNIEALVAWCKRQIQAGLAAKVVIMSATLDTVNLQKYFYNCPVFEVPGTLYPVVQKEIREYQLEEELKYLVSLRKNILVFESGKSEISKFINEYNYLNAEFLPLHSELSNEEQDLCFKSYNRSKVVVATNIAQTSITIPDIDVVIDFGNEKRVEVFDGVEGLYLRNISQSDCLQRKGRAGRVKDGIYYLVSDVPFFMRNEFSIPEIQRLRIDSVVLKFLSIGIDIEELELFHEVSFFKIRESKRLLESLGAIESGKITEIGKKMVKMPLKVQLSRMLIEAEKRGVLKDALIVASILQVGNFIKKDAVFYPKNRQSDILNMMLIFKMLESEYFKTHDYSSYLFDKVDKKSYARILEIRKKLIEHYKNLNKEITTSLNYDDIIMSCLIAYKENIYVEGYYGYKKQNGDIRQIDRNSVCSAKLVFGIPKDISFKNRFGFKQILSTLTMCTNINVDMVKEVIPEIITKSVGDFYYHEADDILEVEEKILVNGVVVETNFRLASEKESKNAYKYIAKLLARATVWYESINNEVLSEICRRNNFENMDTATQFYEEAIKGVRSIKELVNNKKMLNNLKQYTDMSSILANIQIE